MGVSRDTEIALTINPIGNSAGPVIPKKWLRRMGIEEGDKVDAEVDFEEGTVTYHVVDR